MRKTVVINAVGLTPSLIGPATPRLRAFAEQGALATVGHVLPAVTCSVQATYLTGTLPADHGIVGNGWYFRDECEVKLWRQSNQLVQQPSIWEIARGIDPTCTCANLFWWYNMYSSVDYAVTPRPMYPADGRKLLGFRYLMDVIPLDATLVRGSHGVAPAAPADGPLFITQAPHLLDATHVPATDVCRLILRHLTGECRM